jgi:hypothetical protein
MPVPDMDAATRTKRERECRVGQSRDLLCKDTAGSMQMHSLFGETCWNGLGSPNDTNDLSRFRHNPAGIPRARSQRKTMAIAQQAA